MMWSLCPVEILARLVSARFILLDTCCGYDVPGMFLLRDLKGSMRLDRSKNMSVHISICVSYDFNTLTPVVWELWH
jgi:hypothetical protein